MKPRPGRRARTTFGRISAITTSEAFARLGISPLQASEAVPPEPERANREPTGERVDPAEIEGVYIISVAARILEMHPQTLRKYERAGLVMPSRTMGMLRLYSEEDIARLRLIKHLVGDLGLNLAGVHLALGIFNRLLELRSGLSQLEGQELRNAARESIDDIFDLLHARLS